MLTNGAWKSTNLRRRCSHGSGGRTLEETLRLPEGTPHRIYTQDTAPETHRGRSTRQGRPERLGQKENKERVQDDKSASLPQRNRDKGFIRAQRRHTGFGRAKSKGIHVYLRSKSHLLWWESAQPSHMKNRVKQSTREHWIHWNIAPGHELWECWLPNRI